MKAREDPAPPGPAGEAQPKAAPAEAPKSLAEAPKLSTAIDKPKEWRKKRKQKWRANRAVKKKESPGADNDVQDAGERTQTPEAKPEKGKGKTKDSPAEKGKGKWKGGKKGGKKGSDWKGGKGKGKNDKGKATWPSKGAVGGKSKGKGGCWSGKSKGKGWQAQPGWESDRSWDWYSRW